MKKLVKKIVIHGDDWNDCNDSKIPQIVAAFYRLIERVHTKAILPEKCGLEWEIWLGRGTVGTLAHATVRMVFYANLGSHNKGGSYGQVAVPLTEVAGIWLHTDGSFHWFGQFNLDSPEVTRLVQAVTEGKTETRNYRLNWIPIIKPSGLDSIVPLGEVTEV